MDSRYKDKYNRWTVDITYVSNGTSRSLTAEDNLLFQACMEATDATWPAGVSKPTFVWKADGKIMGRVVKTVGDTFEFNRELYADDACFLFASRAELQLGLVHIFDGLKAFGLEMHSGRGGGGAKTEAMFIPASGTESEYGAANLSDLSVDGGTVSYSKSSRYLGSIIAWNLGDGPDVDSRIRAAAQAFGCATACSRDVRYRSAPRPRCTQRSCSTCSCTDARAGP